MTFFCLIPAVEHAFFVLKRPEPLQKAGNLYPHAPLEISRPNYSTPQNNFQYFSKVFPHKIRITCTCEMIWRIFKQCVERFGVLIRLMNLKGLFSVFLKRRVNWEGEKNSSNTSCHVLLRGKQGFVVEL